MSYGIQVSTADGFQDVTELLSAQLVYEEVKTSQSGSDSVSGGVTSANSIGVCLPNDGKVPIGIVTVSNDTISWAAGPYQNSKVTSNFTLRVYRIL